MWQKPLPFNQVSGYGWDHRDIDREQEVNILINEQDLVSDELDCVE